ncbi:MAG: PAS domain-containing protein [Rubrivivax sp.]|nr:PAS domain-containing protein [Rubrivivax sp.]
MPEPAAARHDSAEALNSPRPALGPSDAAAPAVLAAPAVPAALAPLWRMPYPAALLDAGFAVLAFNPSLQQLLGEPAAAGLLGQPLATLLPLHEREGHAAERDALLQALRAPGGDEPVPALSLRLCDAAGRDRWVSMALQALDASAAADSGGPAVARWLALMQDLSLESQARELVRRGQDELDQWFELAGAGMLVYDDDGLIVRCNSALEALVEQVPEVLADAPPELQHLLGWEGGVLPALGAGAPVVEREVVLPLGHGRRRRLAARLARLSGPGLPTGRVMAVVEDRSAEDERDLARLEMGMLMSTASIGVATYDPGRGWLDSRARRTEAPRAPEQADAPEAAAPVPATAGRSALHHISRELVVQDSLPDYERLQRALRLGQRAEVRYAVRHAELGVRWLLTRVEPGVLAAGRRTTSVVTLDVTEQEMAERRNAQLLRELTTILDSSTAGMAYFRGPALVRCNRRFERMLGLEPGLAAGASLAEILQGQGVAPEVIAEAQATLLAARRYDVELQLGGVEPQAGTRAHAAGPEPTRWVAFSVRRADVSGDMLEAVAVLTDITRLKAQQVELERALADRELVFNLSEVGMVVQRGARIVQANQAMAQITGYAVPELTTLDPAELYEDARTCVEFEAKIATALRQSGRFIGERLLRQRGGGQRWVQVAVRTIDQPADPLIDRSDDTICSFVDVDERHRAREALAAQAERTRSVLNSVLVGIVTVGERGIEWMNRSARRMFGGELADFVGEPISTVATPEPSHPLRRDDWWQRAEQGAIETFECRLRGRDGREFWVVGNAVASTLEDGPPQITFALLDIDRRRQAEMSVARAQASLQRLIETAPMAIALFDAARGRLLQVNRTAAALFGIDDRGAGHERALLALPNLPNRTLGEALGGWIAAMTPGAANHHEWRGEMPAEAGVPPALPRDWAAGPASPLHVWDCRLAAVGQALGPDDTGEGAQRVAQVLLLASDVTEQRAANEARLREAIAQREVLVREVHHRIKNNLQGVAGLLRQNADRRPEVAGVLIEAVSQVQAIAQVYGLQVDAARAGSGGAAAAGPLRVARLVASIAQSVQRTFGHTIEVASASTDHLLPEAEAIPLALILNELLANAVRHGGGTPVRCEVRADGEAVEVDIAQQGRLPDGFDLLAVPAGVSGLGLVRALLPRRGARLTLSGEGTEVVARLRMMPPSVKLPPAPTLGTSVTDAPVPG